MFRVGGEEPADDYDDEPRPRRRRTKSSSSSALVPLLIVGGTVAGCLVVAVGFVVLIAKSMPDEKMPPQPVVVGPPPVKMGRPVRPMAPNAINPDYTIMPPRPAGRLGRPAEPVEGPIVVTLSNPRRAESVFPDRPAYQIDYQSEDVPAGGTNWYYLVVKVPAGVGEAHLFKITNNPNGTISFTFFPGSDPGQGFDMWVERRPVGKPAERKRVSKVVTLD
jgi:hypothetical protein